MSKPLAAVLLHALTATPLLAGDIPWERSVADALAAAGAGSKVVFIAVNMDGERANDRMVREVYTDPVIEKLARLTVCLVASNDEHAGEGKTCPRFGGVTCREHRFVDAAVRERVLKPDEEGYVVAPQHVFLAPDGKVILSVPYEVSVPELEWCFAAALRAEDPSVELKLSSKARAPKRLILGDVHAGAAAGDAAPVTREETLELIRELKKGTLGDGQRRAVRRLATADEPEARDYVLGLLRSSARGGPRRGGGGGEDFRPRLLRWIGAASPASYWELCAEFVDGGEEELQREAIVALEQLAAPGSLKVLLARARKEKEPTIEKDLLRAIGATARDDKNARKLLLKAAGNEREPLLRVNAIVALGSLARHADVDELLRGLLAGSEAGAEGDDDTRVAAAVAAGLTRETHWIEPLQAALDGEPEARLKTALEASIAVLAGGRLALLEEPLTRVAEDTIPRRRLFGGADRE